MTRGRSPRRAINLALTIASARGFVTAFKRERGSVCDFIIHTPTSTVIVLVMRSRRLHCTNKEMELQAAEPLARLRHIPDSPYRSRELWACSPYGGFRFFRLEKSGLAETGRDGDPVSVTGSTPGTQRGKG